MHVHSDNSIFIAEMYQEYFFSNNYTESFSRAGTQHQNARAERAIQTIMGMDNSYIIRVSLHCTDRGVDDSALWYFSAKNSVWVYNQVPNNITGIYPMELLANTKSGHSDLLCAHVWGCPDFVLEKNLQNRKIPKWYHLILHAQSGYLKRFILKWFNQKLYLVNRD